MTFSVTCFNPRNRHMGEREKQQSSLAADLIAQLGCVRRLLGVPICPAMSSTLPLAGTSSGSPSTRCSWTALSARHRRGSCNM